MNKIMITEDYVSYEVAKLLKEKGFEILTSKVYDNQKELDYQCTVCWQEERLPYVSAPTHQMAMKWLREVHNMYYEIQLLLGEKAEKYGGLQLGIYQLNSSGAYVWKDWIYADTYVELYENYIKYCLENLI